MPKINVAQSVIINKPVSEVFTELNDFHNWSKWSPWLVLEKEVKVDVEPDGKSYSWVGDIVGSGRMKIENEIENKSVACDLLFLKPWKSKAKTSFDLKEVEGGTKVTWNMASSLPFFMFFMKKSFEGFIAMDYDRGLAMLKDQVEMGKVPSELIIEGITNIDAKKYVGIKRTCSLDELSQFMEADYKKLMPLAHTEWKEKLDGNPFSIYHKWDMKNKQAEYTACVPVSKIPDNLSGEFITGDIPSSKVHKVTHNGHFRHVGNAWSAQMMRMQAKKFKANKKIAPMEIYLNSPVDTPEEDLKSEVVFAVNG